MTETATRSGPGAYFDGLTSALHDVTVELALDGLVLRDAAGQLIDRWPYLELKSFNAPVQMLRIGLRNSDRLARLEIEDPDIADAIDLACPDIDRSGATDRAERRRAIVWSFAAACSLVAVVLYGIPAVADRLVPVVPPIFEHRLSKTADERIRAAFDKGMAVRPFECGDGPGEAAGKAAFEKLVGVIKAGADFHQPLRSVVLRREEANAVTLPGHLYVLGGLIEQANNVDEVAGVIAHELGHLANRDGVRALLKGGGLSLVLGSLLGDFVGGSAVIFASETLLKLSYSRQREAEADYYAVRTMQALKADPRAFAAFMERAAGSGARRSIFMGHPPMPDRVARINAIAPPQSGGATLLDADEWKALKGICAGYR
jgi:Zn-dependent protease with chaperone function